MIHHFKAKLTTYQNELISKFNSFCDELYCDDLAEKIEKLFVEYKEEMSNLQIYDDNRFSYLGKTYLKGFVVEKLIDFHIGMLIQKMFIVNPNYEEVVELHNEYKTFLHDYAEQYETLIKKFLI